MIRLTPAQAQQILAAAQSAQKQLRDWVEFPEVAPPIDAALELLGGILDDSILVRELPPAAVRPDIILTRDEISAGRYRK